MTDYIKREDAINAVADQMAFEASTETGNDYMVEDYIDDAKEWLSGCPSADVAPVRHGRWITKDRIIDCSVCNDAGWSAVPYETLVKHFNYCPNCGAKMDEEE